MRTDGLVRAGDEPPPVEERMLASVRQAASDALCADEMVAEGKVHQPDPRRHFDAVVVVGSAELAARPHEAAERVVVEVVVVGRIVLEAQATEVVVALHFEAAGYSPTPFPGATVAAVIPVAVVADACYPLAGT